MDLSWGDPSTERQLMIITRARQMLGADVAADLSLRLQHLRVVDTLAELELLACPCGPTDRPPGHVVVPLAETHELLLRPSTDVDGWQRSRAVTIVGVRALRVAA